LNPEGDKSTKALRAAGNLPKDSLTLSESWARFQACYSSLLCDGLDHGTECYCVQLEGHYGSHLFKCAKISCLFARVGLSSKVAKARHEATHERRFKCPLPECKWLSFGSQKQVEQHTKMIHVRVNPSGQSTGSQNSLPSDVSVMEQILVDAIEGSDPKSLALILDQLPSLPLNHLMALAYLRGSDVSILNLLLGRGAQVDDVDVIKSLKAVGSGDLTHRHISAALDAAFRELHLELHLPVSAMTLAASASSASVVEWLIC
jgi:hypothetical protein